MAKRKPIGLMNGKQCLLSIPKYQFKAWFGRLATRMHAIFSSIKALISTLGFGHLLGWFVHLLRIPSAFVLVIVNLLPLLAVFFLHWNPFDLIIAYWIENVVIGFFNVFKILLAEGKRAEFKNIAVSVNGKALHTISKVSSATFFTVHYGMFTFIHGVFVLGMFAEKSYIFAAGSVASLLGFVLALIFSHGFSFFYNFLGKGEYKYNSSDYYFSLPYARIFPIHLTIIIGGMLAETLGFAWPVAVFFTLIKLAMDLGGHVFEHRQLIDEKLDININN